MRCVARSRDRRPPFERQMRPAKRIVLPLPREHHSAWLQRMFVRSSRLPVSCSRSLHRIGWLWLKFVPAFPRRVVAVVWLLPASRVLVPRVIRSLCPRPGVSTPLSAGGPPSCAQALRPKRQTFRAQVRAQEGSPRGSAGSRSTRARRPAVRSPWCSSSVPRPRPRALRRVLLTLTASGSFSALSAFVCCVVMLMSLLWFGCVSPCHRLPAGFEIQAAVCDFSKDCSSTFKPWRMLILATVVSDSPSVSEAAASSSRRSSGSRMLIGGFDLALGLSVSVFMW